MHAVKQFILGTDREYLALSRGIDRMDLSEIRQWAPQSGELLSPALMAHSWNFHPLPSGKYCLSRTSRISILFPRENPAHIFTHGLIIPPELLNDYSNNAVTLIRHLEKLGLWRAGIEVARQLLEMAASFGNSDVSGGTGAPGGSGVSSVGASGGTGRAGSVGVSGGSGVSSVGASEGTGRAGSVGASGSTKCSGQVPQTGSEFKEGAWSSSLGQTGSSLNSVSRPNSPANLEILPVLRTLTMDGGSEAVRLESLNAVARTTGIRRFSSILDQVLGNFSTVLSGSAVPEMFIEALLDIFPVGCRAEISFSTGLRFSTNRLFRVVCVGDSAHEQERIRSQFCVPIISTTSVSLMQDQLLPTLKNRWSMFVATLFEQNMESIWGEIALLDETSSHGDLARRARFWFKKLGLDAIYQKIRENRRRTNWNSSEIYEIFQTQVPTEKDAQNFMADFYAASKSEKPSENVHDSQRETLFDSFHSADCLSQFQEKSPEMESSLSEEEMIPPAAFRNYLASISEAMHGNPLAQKHIKKVFQEICSTVPDAQKEEVSEILLRDGVRSWNEEHSMAQNRSWKQVEEMVDTLSTMLNLLGEDE